MVNSLWLQHFLMVNGDVNEICLYIKKKPIELKYSLELISKLLFFLVDNSENFINQQLKQRLHQSQPPP